MDITFRLQWRRLWKYLTIYMSIAIIVPIALMVAFMWVTKGYDQTFLHVSPTIGFFAILGIVAFCGAFGLGIALLCRLMSVRLTDHHLEGRNYWGLKRRLPLEEVSGMSRFDSNGYHATVVSAGRHGKVYVLDQTENVQDVLALLTTCLKNSERKPGPGNSDNPDGT